MKEPNMNLPLKLTRTLLDLLECINDLARISTAHECNQDTLRLFLSMCDFLVIAMLQFYTHAPPSSCINEHDQHMRMKVLRARIPLEGN